MKVLEKSSRDRTSERSLLAMLFGVLWIGTTAVGLSKGLQHNNNQLRSFGTIFLLVAVLIGVGLLVWVVWRLFRNYETGSFVDLDLGQLVYWDGPSPAQREIIDLKSVVAIHVVASSDSESSVELIDRLGNKRTVYERHLPEQVAP